MRVRDLGHLCQLPKEDRYPILAEGLELLVNNVWTIHSSLTGLEDWGAIRGYRILRQLLEEESAKFLILLDYIRCPDSLQREQSRQLKYFYDHFVRLLYAEYCDIRPATWGEVDRWVELMRPKLHLDGPLGVEWIFRNDLIQKREQQMYVDYVEMDNEHQWIGPAQLERDEIRTWELRSTIYDLVNAMYECGFATSEALAIVNTQWSPVRFNPNTHWRNISYNNRETIARLVDSGVTPKNIRGGIISYIIDRWYFPLWPLGLRLKEITREELERIQEDFNPE